MLIDWHTYLAFVAWNAVIFIIFLAGCWELDERDDAITDLGERPINAEGWNW